MREKHQHHERMDEMTAVNTVEIADVLKNLKELNAKAKELPHEVADVLKGLNEAAKKYGFELPESVQQVLAKRSSEKLAIPTPRTAPLPALTTEIFQPSSVTGLYDLPKGSVIDRAGERLVFLARTTGFAGNGISVFNESKQADEQIRFAKEDFKARSDGFTIGNALYQLVRFGTDEDHALLASSWEKIRGFTDREIEFNKSKMDVAKLKGEELGKIRDKLTVGLWRDWLRWSGISYSSAQVYLQTVTCWDQIDHAAESPSAALKEYRRLSKPPKPENDKPKLSEREKRVVDRATEYKVRGAAANLIRFLLSYGLKEQDL